MVTLIQKWYGRGQKYSPPVVYVTEQPITVRHHTRQVQFAVSIGCRVEQFEPGSVFSLKQAFYNATVSHSKYYRCLSSKSVPYELIQFCMGTETVGIEGE